MKSSATKVLERLRAQWPDETDALLIMEPNNRRYLSSFTGTAGLLLVTPNQSILVTDFRYWEQAQQQSPEWQIYRQQGSWLKALQEVLTKSNWKNIAIEYNYITLTQQELLTKALPDRNLLNQSSLIEIMRSVKDEAEQEKIARAVALADRGFEHILTYVQKRFRGSEGEVREKEIALELEFFLRKEGAEGIAFDFIVASGERSALPHGVATDKALQEGEFVTIDFGCRLDGYCSDTTRTFFLGKPTEEHQKVYRTVLQAQQEALEVLGPGKIGSDLDQVAREIIEKAGYGSYFGHGLGHGVGLVVHEKPQLSPSSDDILQVGQVVTVEPGIYIPQWGGVRIEDMVIITDSGCRNLTKAPKELICL
ncbi:aminopeptidase P family protein [Heliorestis acidaminivorans]|uniref:Aminopeptidase P family protein n=1 Tax=Heliorestis acidaminivorans TaxID=553427 RepID=A0A6I0EQL7_9FIRM|nr:Xaa-Pro peptidase family protein [Heliorestis acidaminivorans]KAB2951666.1 aminopeptidase P family protein [Heliorestis acidaminivorans]